MLEKKWFPVKEYEGYYEITTDGKIRSLNKHKYHYEMQQRIDRAGYLTVRLRKNDKGSTQFVHRLLAKTFIPNPDNKCCVNHKDGNKLNNSLGNLEWNTHSENMIHAYAHGLCKKTEKYCMKVIDYCSGIEYKNISEAAKAFQIPYSTCKNYLNGRRPNPTCLRYAA